MSDADLLFRPATELAALVRAGDVSARELTQLSLDRIEALDPELNAFVDVFAEEALAAADAVAPGDERPFAGVPTAIKNNRAVAGTRLTFGADFAGDFTAGHDDNVVAKMRAAGFVIVGSTTLPEFGLLPTTETKRFGPTRNPWDTDRTPGGSSGGSAAAVAAGVVPLAHANDGGGSIRIPAACCGLVGLKPQRGRISMAPLIGELFLVQDGVLTHSVQDTAALLDLLAGPVLGDSSWAPPPAEPFAVSARREPGRLRIAWTDASPLGDDVSDEDRRAVREAAELLASLGHEVVEDTPPWTQPDVLRLFTASFGPAVSGTIAFLELVNGRKPEPGELEPITEAVYALSRGIDSVDALGAGIQLQAFARGIVQWTAQYDALLTPSLAEAPLPIGTLQAIDDPLAAFARAGRYTPFHAMSNITGSPAISLPLFEREGGLPLGVQLVGQPAEEGALLALAAQLEAARPWADRRPALAATA
jgi:amidase